MKLCWPELIIELRLSDIAVKTDNWRNKIAIAVRYGFTYNPRFVQLLSTTFKVTSKNTKAITTAVVVFYVWFLAVVSFLIT